MSAQSKNGNRWIVIAAAVLLAFLFYPVVIRSIDADAGTFVAIFILVALLAVYFLPALVANHRGRDNEFMIAMLNLLLGWTVLGWLVLLIVAFTGDSFEERQRKAEQTALLRRIAEQGGNLPE